MLEGKIVRVRFLREFPAEPVWVFLGKVVAFHSHWIAINGKGVLVLPREAVSKEDRVFRGRGMVTVEKLASDLVPADIDEEFRVLWFPRNTISNIRVLPDNFDLDTIHVVQRGRKLDILVDDAPDTSIDERYED